MGIRVRLACLLAALLVCTWGLTAFGQGAGKKSTKKGTANKEEGGRAPEPNPNGKHGGVLHAVLRENPTSLSPQEGATISDVWPVASAYNNLVLYDPFRQVESGDHLIAELAESWDWSDGGKTLTFKLRHGVTWHDGKPFTGNDVKFTFDVARGASEKKFKLNPRKNYWENIQDIATNGDYEVSFHLKRPQPSLVSFMATGYAPIYPAHIEPQELRLRIVGTGPFMLKEYKPDERLVLEKNPHYFIKDRPYLDGIEMIVIKDRSARTAALQAGQVDINFPGEGTAGVRDQIKSAVPSMVVFKVAQSVSDNIILNLKKPPFDNPKIARAVSLAMNRAELIQSVAQGAAVPGGANLPQPYGAWGLTPKELATLPGYGDPAKNKAEARKLLAAEGFGPNNPLKVTVSTRNIAIYVDIAVWVIGQLKEVGIEATLEQVESALWFPKVAKRDFQIGLNLTGVAADDPDANFFENYACGSQRNYTDYCSPEVEAMMAAESTEFNKAKRLKMVHDIDKRLQMESARPMLDHKIDYFMMWPYVKNLVPHHNIYNYGRMQDVWLDK